MARWLSLFFFLPLALSAQSSHTLLLQDGGEYDVKGKLYYFQEAGMQRAMQQVMKEKFLPLAKEISPSLGFNKNNHWFRLDLDNQSGQKDWLMEFAYAPLDHLEIFFQNETGQWQSKVSGDEFPVSSREFNHRNIVFPMAVAAGKQSVYIKLKSSSSLYLPIVMWKADAFYNAQLRQEFAHGIFYGILIIMIFYNLFLYFSIRDVNTLYYIFTLLAGINVIAFFQGYGFYFLYPEHPELNPFFTILGGPLFIVASGLLARSFLDLGRFNFWLDRILLAITIVTILAALNITTLTEAFSYKSIHLLMVFNCLLILISAVYCFYKKYRPARYFLLAWISLLLAVTFFSLRNLGFIHSNWLTESSLYFGGIMQTLLISLALGDRINILTKENQQTKEIAIKQEQLMKDRLEKTVVSRTEEIRSKNERLEEVNGVKDKLFSVISHDLKGPLNSLRGTLSLLQFNVLSPADLQKVTETISSQLQDTSNLLDHLLQWGRTQIQGINFNPQLIKMNEVIESAVAVLRHEFSVKGVEMTVTLSQECEVVADEVMLSTVVRNLLSNALKFTPEQGEVRIETRVYDSMIIVMISDSGVGIPPVYRDGLFTLAGVTTLGTREEKGTGIGLVLCREFVERNGGAIWVESEEGTGSKFSFSVPLKK